MDSSEKCRKAVLLTAYRDDNTTVLKDYFNQKVIDDYVFIVDYLEYDFIDQFKLSDCLSELETNNLITIDGDSITLTSDGEGEANKLLLEFIYHIQKEKGINNTELKNIAFNISGGEYTPFSECNDFNQFLDSFYEKKELFEIINKLLGYEMK